MSSESAAKPGPVVVDGRYLLVRPVNPVNPEGAWLAVDLEHRAVVVVASDATAHGHGPSLYLELVPQGAEDAPLASRYAAELHPCGPGGAPEPDPRLLAALERVGGDARRGPSGASGSAAGPSGSDAPPLVAELLGCLGEPDPEARAHAAFELGQAGDPAAVGPLIAALEDPDPDVRRYAADALGRIGDARAVQPLVSRLQDSDAWVTQWAASALAALGNSPRTYGYAGEYTVVDDSGEERTIHAED